MAASRLGVPDLGLVTHTEMLDVARNVTARASVPVIADIDTGFGGVLNVARTVEEFAAAGVAAVHLEDQTFPKRCGHLAGKAIVDEAEFLARVRAADRGRGSGAAATLLIARTDALAVDGIDAAIDRANRALAAGADIAFVEGPRTRADVVAISSRVEGRILFNMVAGGVSPSFGFDELAQMGFDLVIVPPIALYPATQAIRTTAAAVLEARSDAPLRELGIEIAAFFELLGLGEWLALDTSLRSGPTG